MADEHLLEKKIASEEILRGHFLHAMRDTVRMPDGNTSIREYIIHPGAVMIIPLLQDEQGQTKLVLERQFRYPMNRVMIEFPAGKIDAGEDGLACAKRELREETGYSALQWARAGVLHPVISYSTEFIDVWFARGLSAGTRALDAGETLDVFSLGLPELLQWCQQGLVTDAKTLTGVLWLQNVLAGNWELQWQ